MFYSTWDNLLKKHVTLGKVDYKGFASESGKLKDYLERIAKKDLTNFSRNEKLAFWINAYNAFTVELILNHYPVKSIRKINRPWGKKIWIASGKKISLDDIEHKILRKEIKEYRIHFAIVCASIGCPDLQPYAFNSKTIEEQLNYAAKHFFSKKKHFYIKTRNNDITIYLSKIFKWFGKDFGKTKKKRIESILPFLKAEDAEKIKNSNNYKIVYLDYDWDLNGKRI